MITELRVRDLVTIADVTLKLGPGLNALTGETGAGKSMLVDAVALLLGARADSTQVRPGAQRAAVEGALEVADATLRRRLEELGLEPEDGRLVVRREIGADGRSRAWVNGSPATIGTLARLGSLVVDLHGQHETQSLLHPDAQRDILDAFAGALPERAALEDAWRSVSQLRAEEHALGEKRDEVRRRADYLRHVVQEIDDAKLAAGEDEALDLEARRLGHAGTLAEQARRLAALLDDEEGGTLPALGQADRLLGGLERIDATVTPWRELLDGAYAGLTELARLAQAYADGLEEDPARLTEVERRRDVLYRLKQKHGTTLDAVLATRAEAARELDLLDTADLDLRQLAARRVAAEGAAQAAADALSAKRKEAGARLARGVSRLLPQLGLAGGKLDVELAPLGRVESSGQEGVTFMVRLNAGLEPRALARAASGGELSRIMLALKVVLARHDQVPTLVFDEIDAGIGGEVGAEVGAALAEVAARRQVLVITHLPQIAARAERHLVVSKVARRGLATSDVQQIHGEDRVTEIARMLGDADAATARQHAAALLGDAVRR
ncbi:MAG: DNA repair protein RecN [Gemmatimonadetes bacterium]|nr:DNA repair protein RecN [Gemmatimonadota bacterium]MBK7713891.1 DNA repair protein RecN [Gemmatimonadota bacterium]